MNHRTIALLVAMTAGLAACGDDAVGPTADASSDDAYVHAGGASLALSPTDKYHFQMTIDPRKNTIWDLGAGNTLKFPRGTLCEPTKSTYGAGQWDKPCEAAKSSVTLNVTVWVDDNGHPRVDFEPSVRFVPSSDPREWVVLTFADWEAAVNPWFNINYCPTATSNCYNEAAKDPSLATVRDEKTGKITRRLKHFSGYNVAAGMQSSEMYNIAIGGDEEPSTTPTTLPGMSVSVSDFDLTSVFSIQTAYPGLSDGDATDFLARINAGRRLSGYILASGYQER